MLNKKKKKEHTEKIIFSSFGAKTYLPGDAGVNYFSGRRDERFFIV
jgi:hypothetical protein